MSTRVRATERARVRVRAGRIKWCAPRRHRRVAGADANAAETVGRTAAASPDPGQVVSLALAALRRSNRGSVHAFLGTLASDFSWMGLTEARARAPKDARA